MTTPCTASTVRKPAQGKSIVYCDAKGLYRTYTNLEYYIISCKLAVLEDKHMAHTWHRADKCHAFNCSV